MNDMGYDSSLVMGSACVAVFICYVAISLEQLIFVSRTPRIQKMILCLSGMVFGFAIWAMHFLGLWAGDLPEGYTFDLSLTIISYVIAALASTFAIWLMTRETLPIVRLVLGALLMGLGISGMHYVGMMGLQIPNQEIHYNILLVVFSVLIAISGAGLSFWLAFKYKNTFKHKILYKIALSVMLAFSIVGMHYTGMAATTFHSLGNLLHTTHHVHGGQGILLLTIIFVTSLILVSAFSVAVLERRLEERNLQLLQANKELEDLALQDNLTKLPNRLFLEDHIQKLFQHYKVTHQKFALIYLDLDFFKAVNDNFGHQVGDDLLVALTTRLQTVLHDNQTLLRLGGDEFLVIVPQIKEVKLDVLAEKILEKIQQRFLIHEKQINISASLGIVLYPDHGQSLQDLLIHADTAKMLAKEQGRNTFCIYHQNSDDYFQHRHQSKLVNDLYCAVDEQQFVLYYQPKFTADYKICGVEALIRWQHPTLGLLAPNKFIEVAEQTGLIIRMGYWALEQACIQLQSWHQRGMPFCPIAVNLSAMQFEHKHLITTLDNLMQKYQIQAKELIVEITESTAMHHIEKSIATFEQLKALGILLAIDDFGTGHSSFLYLKNLPVDELKIDREFIRNLCEGSKDEIILESIIHLAIRLGLIVTAEGVETEQQAAILKRLNCQQLQGFLFGKPKPIQCLENKYFAAQLAAHKTVHLD
ncbi:putative bifunctional diguanylate cyclase/phosphodiesterase [Acinetobacter piscicola]|uniref:putative bifunctional diguanylate cyclase/phosphodiesterase n=1 Tax=Acinetobacter piscicola TaxID=2006115 RepID=UPI00355764AE